MSFTEAVLSNESDSAFTQSQIEVFVDGEKRSYALDSDGSTNGQILLSSSTDVAADADVTVNFTTDIRDTVDDDNTLTGENLTATVTGAT
ncbi:MAG: hypothetical protein SVW77_00790, partial [Candidatus Nanohaloarchaea archaeon]|nr:hypothetical protein [Candidatus Nanohaloarchaea archaeon]